MEEYMVKTAMENENKSRLINECHKQSDGERIRKTKTAHIVDKITDPFYTLQPQKELKSLTNKKPKYL